jgi:inositol oxygenase
MSVAQHSSLTEVPAHLIHDGKTPDNYRNYEAETRSTVKELYSLNHRQQTLDFVLAQKAKYGQLNRAEMSIWEAMESLNQLVDDSDPDLALPQIVHALQTAEAIRQDGHPRWFILVGLIHDLGKVLCLFNENPDSQNPKFNTLNGIYEAGCGLDNVHLSYGHDEYLYQVVKNYLPEEALWMIRYHSCYVVHREGEYGYLLTPRDHEMLKNVRAFNPYDLYSKVEVEPNFEELRGFYEELVSEFFPAKLKW